MTTNATPKTKRANAPNPQPEHPSRTSVEQRCNLSADADLTSSLENFLKHATIADKLFLRRVFERWDGHQTSDPEQLHIARAFETELQSPDTSKELRRANSALSVCQLILDNERGSMTPFETFFLNLLFEYNARPPRPEQVRKMVDEFESDFNDAVKEAIRFAGEYPDLVGGAQ